MKAFMDKDFLLETETAKKLFHDYAEKHRFWTTIAISIPKRLLRIVSSTTSLRYGWAAITTSGVSCVPAVWTKSTSPVTLPITRSSANGLSAWARLSATPVPLEPSGTTEILRLQWRSEQKHR